MQGTAGNGPRLAGVAIGFAVFLATVVPTAAAPLPSEALSRLEFEIAPSKLSSTEPTPVRMEVAGRHRTADGSHLTPTKELRFQADRHLALDLKGVPGCRRPGLDVRRDVAKMEDLCPESIIGRGQISVEVEFPGQQLTVRERLIVYKASDSPAGIDLVAFTFLPAPVTAEIVIPIYIRRVNQGRIGWEARLSIPKIAGGAGSLTGYALRIGRRFLSATCVGGKLQLRVFSGFDDGTRRSERVVSPCTVAKAGSSRS
jgi:hypothetical protein